MIEVFKDITLRKKLEMRLFELSITDELTSLLNRRGFIEMSDKQISLADRTSGDLFLLYSDIFTPSLQISLSYPEFYLSISLRSIKLNGDFAAIWLMMVQIVPLWSFTLGLFDQTLG